MLAAVLVSFLVAQVPCASGESSLVCHCKAGLLSACAALAQKDEALAKEILRALTMAKAAKESKQVKEQATATVDTGCGQPPDDGGDKKCTGQYHHIISKVIFRALEDRPSLKGLYKYRDPRFVARAVDEEAHCGYQHWHIELDKEIAKWIREQERIGPEKFEAYLREVYKRPELQVRFPNGF